MESRGSVEQVRAGSGKGRACRTVLAEGGLGQVRWEAGRVLSRDVPGFRCSPTPSGCCGGNRL